MINAARAYASPSWEVARIKRRKGLFALSFVESAAKNFNRD